MKKVGVKKQIRLHDIAVALDISVSSVSLALRNSPKISQKLREDVCSLAAKLGYHPNALAVGLAKTRSEPESDRLSRAGLAWINYWKEPEQMRSYKEYSLYWEGARESALSQGFSIEEFKINQRLTPARLEGILRSRNVEGILLPPHPKIANGTNLLLNIDWSQRALVKLGYSIDNFPVHTFTSNHVQCAMLAMERMREKGYRRIGFVSRQTTHTQFIAGMLMFQSKLTEDCRIPEFVCAADERVQSRVRLKAWMDEYKPDAILSDFRDTRQLLESIGWKIPSQVGLASTSVLDGNANAGLNQNSFEIGKVAVNKLIDLIYRREFGIPKLQQETLVNGSWRDGVDLPDKIAR